MCSPGAYALCIYVCGSIDQSIFKFSSAVWYFATKLSKCWSLNRGNFSVHLRGLLVTAETYVIGKNALKLNFCKDSKHFEFFVGEETLYNKLALMVIPYQVSIGK